MTAMKIKRTIWEANDRQGTKHFSKRPEFLEMHDIFIGTRCAPSKGDRVMRSFRVKVKRVKI